MGSEEGPETQLVPNAVTLVINTFNYYSSYSLYHDLYVTLLPFMQASPEQARLNSCVLSTGPGTEEWLLNAEGVKAMHDNVSVFVHPGTTTPPKGHCSHPQGHAPAERGDTLALDTVSQPPQWPQ